MADPVTVKSAALNLEALPELIKSCDLQRLVILEQQLSDALKQVGGEKSKRAQKELAAIEAEAKKRKEELARLAGMSPDELGGDAEAKPKRGKRAPAVPKYCDPDDPSATWSGRGRKPKWVEKYLAAGKTLKDLEISQAPKG